MNCPACRTVNPAAAKFCFNCGTPLLPAAARCSNCGGDLPAGARFCMNCGQPVNLTTPADDERLTRLAAAAPAPLAEKMRAAHLTGERKIVTCLFADVVGSTALAERLDADDWTAIMNRAFDRMSPAIYRYEGTIARLMGDAILAFFGAPVAHEDDPERAVRAALDLIAAAAEYAGEVSRAYGIEFAIRVGLNTGPVVVGNVGSDLKFEYTAMGDAVNLAARMQSAARPMTTLIAEPTYRFVAPVFEVTDLGPLEVKGKSEPVHVYEVIGPKAERGRLRGLEAAGIESPMVGRQAELGRLLAASAAVRSGTGQVVAVVGEAGLGKSRLIAEWHSAATRDGAPVTWAAGHCLSYGQGQPYHLLIDLLRSLSTSAPEAAGPSNLYLDHLLSRPLDAAALEQVAALGPHDLQHRYRGAVEQFLRALAARRPLILILDDVHWADPSSTDLLISLLPLIGEAPVLVGLLCRPDREAPGWKLIEAARARGAAFTEVALNPLSADDSQRLVTNLLEVEALPERVRALILDRAEGNPFFVEEVIRMLMDRGLIARQARRWVAAAGVEAVDLPDNLQALLLARIDRLADEAKRTLRVASVIGRRFAVRVLEQVLTVARQLEVLEAAGLIRPAEARPDLEYLFRHALMQEAAYGSLVKRDRRQLHLAVGEALERLYPDRLDSRELAPVLGQHFYHAGDDERALKYLTLAGDAAARVYANAEAIQHYTLALEIARRVKVSDAALLHLYTGLGNTLELNADYAAAMQNYAELEAAALARRDRRMEFSAVMARAKLLATPNPAFDPAEGRRALERALALAREIGGRADECHILWNLMVLDTFSGGDVRRAIANGEQAIALARELGLRERLAFAVNDIYYAYVALDDNETGWARLDEARELWRELNIVPMLADNLANSAIRQYERAEFERAVALADESYRLYQSIDNVYGIASSRFCASAAHLERGELDRALAVIDEGQAAAEKSGHVAALIVLLIDRARLHAVAGQPAEGLEHAQRAAALAASKFQVWTSMGQAAVSRLLIDLNDLAAAALALEAARRGLKPETVLLYGREKTALAACALALAQNDAAAALAAADDLLALIARVGSQVFRPEALLFRARALAAQGDQENARQALHRAEADARRFGARLLRWQALAELCRLDGDGAAQAVRDAAATEAAFIADHISSPDLRAAFLHRRDVRSVVQSSPGPQLKGPPHDD